MHMAVKKCWLQITNLFQIYFKPQLTTEKVMILMIILMILMILKMIFFLNKRKHNKITRDNKRLQDNKG